MWGLSAVVIAQLATGFSVRLTDDDPPTVARWASDVVSYRLQLAGSDDLAPAEALAAVRAAFATWAAIDCATVTFTELGDAPDPAATLAVKSVGDGHNDVVWVEDDQWAFGEYVLGVTAPLVGPDGRFVEADIAFNGLQVQWTVRGNGGTDLESVAVHEIGHFIGAQHNLGPYAHVAPPTMAPFVAGGIQNRTLEPDDRQVACYLYPAVPFTCIGDEDCPLLLSQTFEANDFYSGRFRCARPSEPAESGVGACTILDRFLPDGVGFGERCHRPEECVAGLVCHPYIGAGGNDGGMCTTGCDPFAAGVCRAGYHCEAFPAPLEKAGMCLPDDGIVLPPGSGPDGCQSTAICAPGSACLPLPQEDVEGLHRCATICEVAAGDADCPLGQRCWSYGRPNGGCFPASSFPPEPVEEPPEPTVEDAPDDVVESAPEISAEPIRERRDEDGCGAASGGIAWWLALVGFSLRARCAGSGGVGSRRTRIRSRPGGRAF